MLETGNVLLDDEAYAALSDAQYSHVTGLSAVQPGIKVQPHDLLLVLHGTANHSIASRLGQRTLPVDIVGQPTYLLPTVGLTL